MSHLVRIAISGGGLAGASLFHALLNYNHLDVHIFESAASFKEAGATIGVACNALAALDLIGPSTAQCFKRAGAFPLRGVRFMLAQGEGQGQMIGEADDMAGGKRVTSIVHRAAYLRELLADVPQERMHASQKLDIIDWKRNGSTTLYFTDGTTHECDILVGDDGIYSSGQLVQFVIASYEKDAEGSDRWHQSVSAGGIKRLYQHGPPRLNKAANELLCAKLEQTAKYLWEQPQTRSYISGPICIIGDAAHATTAWQGSGSTVSIEDSPNIPTLLGHAKTPAKAVTAVKVYD
ncbi:hypothetical protein DL769_008466 [Monosporascus sp. CRB-8-3]|nr:hypothetical protein DL769_008466 [Monosporascus sp. CRB-8-3]